MQGFKHLRPAAATLLLPVALAACSASSKPHAADAAVTVPANPGPQWTVPVDADGRNDSKDWPDACDLLTDEQVKAAASATTVSHRGETGLVFGPTARTTVTSVHSIGCTYDITLPDAAQTHSFVRVRIFVVNTPDRIMKAFNSQHQEFAAADKDLGTTLGGARCYIDSENVTINCAKGQFQFSVNGANKSPTTDEARQNTNWRDAVLAPLTSVIAARM